METCSFVFYYDKRERGNNNSFRGETMKEYTEVETYAIIERLDFGTLVSVYERETGEFLTRFYAGV
jgi:hypothetical protein